MNSLTPPKTVYVKPLSRGELRWVVIGAIWCVVLFVTMYAWPALGGRQQTPFESYRIDVAEFRSLAEAFIAENTVGSMHGVPIVTPNAAGEVYLAAQAFTWRPVLQLTKGETARIYLSSYDVQHGMSIQPMNLNFQVLPGYVYVVHLTPTEVGEFPVICNEYCGLGHHSMAGRIIVVE